jgi:hypothetical protein
VDEERRSGPADQESDATSEAVSSTPGGGESRAEELSGTARSDELPGFEDAPIRRTAYDVSGFGIVPAVVALLVVAGIAARIRAESSTHD